MREGDINQENREDQESTYDPSLVYVTGNWSFKLSHLRYLTFLTIGIALLWPWNSFLSASAYYGERFSHSEGLAKKYSSTMMTVSTLTSMIGLYYLSQAQKGANYKRRTYVGFSLIVAIFFVLAISCVSDGFIKMNDGAFFTLFMFMVLVTSIATSFAQNGSLALVNVAGSIYANALMVGQAVSGVLPSIALIVSILIVGDRGSKKEKEKYVEKNYGIFFYYIAACIISLLAMALLAVVGRYHKITMYHSINASDDEFVSSLPEEESEAETQKIYVPFGVLWSKLKLIVMGIFFTFCITLVFPVFASSIESKHTDSKFVFFKKDIFIPFIYLVWNMGDLAGRILCGLPNSKFLVRDPKSIFIFSLLRILFIPLFLAFRVPTTDSNTNAKAVINSDFGYVLLQGLFGLTNGQLCTSCFMVVGDFCDTDDEKEAAGGFTTVFLSIGLAAGSLFSYAVVLLLG